MDVVYRQHQRIPLNLTTRWPRLLCAFLAMAGTLALTPARAASPADADADVDVDVLSALEQGLRPSMLAVSEPLPGWSLQERMAFHRVPGVALAVIRDGRVVQSAGYGVREAGTDGAINADMLFSVGSVSKVVTAATTLREVVDGRLDLDRDVNTYLTSWKVPKAPAFQRDTLTLRMLMSHTSGLTVWGFKDYQPGEALPSTVQTLDGVKPAQNEPVRIDFEPGTRMRYSGGGVTVEQLVLQDSRGKTLEAVARAQVFKPLGMQRSTFANPLPASLGNIAKAHDREGRRAALPRGWEAFPEQAASGLWTSANDLGAFVAALTNAYRGRDGFLPQPLAQAMMTEVWPSIHGLGPRLEGEGDGRFFHHGRSNDSYRAWIEGHLASGDGIVILTDGTNGHRLAAEIRNALADALGNGITPVVRTIAPSPVALTDYTGTWRLDTTAPKGLAGNLAGYFESDTLTLAITDGLLTLQEGDDQPQKLQALTPARFIGDGDVSRVRYEFLRDAQGQVHTLLAERGSGRLYFRRNAALAGR